MAEEAEKQFKEEKKRNDLLLIACSKAYYHDVEELISQGVSLEYKDKQGSTALHFAAAAGAMDICKLLISKGADAECEDRTGQTPLHAAATHDHAEIIPWLVSKAAWVDAYDSVDDTPLHCAARYASPATVSALVKAGAKTTVINKRALTPMAEALLRGRMDAVKVLEDGEAAKGARPRGYSLLHLAAGAGSLEGAKYLLAQSADPNCMSNNGLTPLHCAAAGGHLRVAELLLKHKADPTILSSEGLLPHHMVPLPEEGPGAVEQETLMTLLKNSTGGKPGRRASAHDPGADASASDGTNSFAQLPRTQQISQIQAWATWGEDRLKAKPELNPETIRRIQEVRRMQGVLDVHTAVLDVHSDTDFQVDAKVPRVLEAIEIVREDPSKLQAYKTDSVVLGVISKLKRFQDLTRSHGNTQSINLKDLVLKDSNQLAKTKKRQQTLKYGYASTLSAAIAAASFFAEEDSVKAATEIAEGGSDVQKTAGDKQPDLPAEAKGEKNRRRPEPPVDFVQDTKEEASAGAKSSYTRQLVRSALIMVVSLVLAYLMTLKLHSHLEEAAAAPTTGVGQRPVPQGDDRFEL